MAERLKGIGTHIGPYGLVIVLLSIGGMEFTTYEAEGIRPMLANSPLMGWAYSVMSVGAFSSLLGVIEIATGLLIALRPVWPLGSAIGSRRATGTFLATLTFLFTTPGWEKSLGGFGVAAHAGGCPAAIGARSVSHRHAARAEAGVTAIFGRRIPGDVGGSGQAIFRLSPVPGRRPVSLSSRPSPEA